MGRAQGRRFDRYIESGDESWLGINDEDRDSLPTVTGALSFDGSDPAAKADSQERRRFFRALRDMSERRPAGTLRLHVFGFDVDFFPTLAFRDVRDGIGANHPRLASVARAVDRAREASGAEAARRMSEAGQILHEGWRDASAELGGEAAYALEADIGSLAATLRFQSIALHDPTPDQLLTAYATRERNMFWLLDRHFARSLAEGTALIGHNMHLSKHSSSIGFGRAGAVVPMWPSVGDHVRERWADDVASVWFLYAAGQHGTHAGCKARGCDIPRHPEAIETELATAGSRFVVTTAAAEAMFPALRAAGHFIQNGELGFGVVSEQADVFVFDETVTAPRLDVEAPARLP